MTTARVIAVAYGDGVGPEVMDAALTVLQKAGANLEIEAVQLGQRVYDMGSESGVLPSAWEALSRTQVLLKSPTIMPEGETVHHSTTVICQRFNVATNHPTIESCPGHPDIQAAAYIGDAFAVFEPLQSADPALADKNKAHPAAMLLAAVMLLRHIGQTDVADRVYDALLDTLASSRRHVKTSKFVQAVIDRLYAAPAGRLPVANC